MTASSDYFDETLAATAELVTSYKCAHGDLVASVWRTTEGLWVEAGPVKMSPGKAALIGIANRSIGRRKFSLENALLFSGVSIDGRTIDGSTIIAGCRDHQLVLSLLAMRDDANEGVKSRQLPDPERRVCIGKQ